MVASVRNQWLLLATLALLLIAGSACNRRSPAKEVTLQVIGEDYSPMQGLAKIDHAFTSEFGVKVHITRVDAETLRKRYLAEFRSGGSDYDVIMGEAFDLGLLAANQWTVNISRALTDPNLLDPKFEISQLPARLLNLSCRYHGTLYGLPCSSQCMFLWYRKDLFDNPSEKAAFLRRYGYPLPQPTPQRSMTWAQYRDVAEFFTRKAGELAAGQPLKQNLYGTLIQGKNHLALWFEFQNFLYSFGGKFVNDASNTVVADSPQALRALKYYLGLRTFSPPGTDNYNWDDALLAFENGRVAMAIMWSDSISAVEDASNSSVVGKVGFAANPTVKSTDSPVSVYGGWGFFVNKKSRHRAAAVHFIQWANRPEVQVRWAKHGGIPAVLSAYQSPELRGVPGMATQREALKHLVAWTRAPYSGRLISIGQNELARATAGQANADAVLHELASRYQRVLEDYSTHTSGTSGNHE